MKKIILSFQYRIKNQYKLTILTEFPSLMTISYFIKTHEFKFKFADYQTNGMDQIAVPTQDWYPIAAHIPGLLDCFTGDLNSWLHSQKVYLEN